MPTTIKIVVATLVLALALTAFWLESGADSGNLRWVMLGLGGFMALSLWMFPEPKMRDEEFDEGANSNPIAPGKAQD